MRNVKPARVYVIQSETGAVKIGRSEDPDGRLRAIQAAHPAALKLCHSSAVREDCSLVESTAHRLLANKRKIGEWFDVSVDDAIAAVAKAIDEVEKNEKGGRPRYFTMRADDELWDALDKLQIRHVPVKSRTEIVKDLIFREAAKTVHK